MTNLAQARRALCGRKIVSIELAPPEGGGVILTLDNGTKIEAGVRDPEDEDGAVNGYAAVNVRTKHSATRGPASAFSLG